MFFVEAHVDPLHRIIAIDGAGNDVVEPEKVFGKVLRESADDRDGDVQAPVRRVSVGDEDIVANPDIVVSASVCCGVKLRGRVKPRPERPEGQDPALEQERLKPVKVQ